MQDKIKISIVDDQPLFRQGIKYILKEFRQFTIISESDSSKTFLRSLKTHVPDVVLLDVENDSQKTVQFLERKYPALKVLIPAFHNPSALPYTRIKKVMHEVLSNPPDKLFVAAHCGVQQIMDVFNELIIRPIIEDFLNKITKAPKTNQPALTRREEQVLQLAMKGYKRKEIAEILSISTRTFDTHRDRIIEKTGVKKLADLFGNYQKPEPAKKKSKKK